VGFFRTRPGPLFLTALYLIIDLAVMWPYMASNAAVPLAAVWLGRLPGAQDDALVRNVGYAIFLAAFVPLIFGGKIYNALERVMVTKLVLVLAYLGLLALFATSWETKWEIVSGFYRFGALPEGSFNWATLAAFAAIAGAGGMTNSTFAVYARDKGWGMGPQVGALPSAVGGRTIRLSHTGKVFEPSPEHLVRWRGWLAHIRRDQFLLWAPACVVGMALPAVVSYEFLRGVQNVEGHAVAAMTAQGIAARLGPAFWYLTLLCGFAILAPTQVSLIDAIARRWTDVLWTGFRRLHRYEGHQVKLIYYSILAVYCAWGLLALRITPNPLLLAMATGVIMNFALAFSALHTLHVLTTLLPQELRPGWLMRSGLLACAAFYFSVSACAFVQQWPKIVAWAKTL
jgi:hypothetical protein